MLNEVKRADLKIKRNQEIIVNVYKNTDTFILYLKLGMMEI